MSEVRAPTLADGAVLGRLYRVRRRIGQGAQGDVYEVQHERLGTRFAAKVLLPYLQQDPAAISRFEREASTASQLNHPNIARVVNFDQMEDGQFFTIMELLEGEDLQTLLSRGPLPVGEACRLALDIASALEAAHDAGVVHRDLKPSNLFLAKTPTGPVIKLTDFGISKITAANEDTKLTSTGAVVGTPMYMAPEQASGDVVDGRTDLYALGVVLFEMLAGQPPFAAKKSHQLIVEKTLLDPPDARRLLPELPRPIADVVTRCLAKKPGDRFDDMHAFSEALGAAASTLSPEVGVLSRFDAPDTIVSLATLTATRKKRTGLFVMSGLVGGVGVGIAIYLAALRPSIEPAPAVERPAAPPPAKVAVSPIVLESYPNAASVVAPNGEVVGTTPVALVVEKAGRYTLRTKDGHNASVDLDPSQAGKSIQVQLAAPPATKPPPPKRRRRKKRPDPPPPRSEPEPLPVEID